VGTTSFDYISKRAFAKSITGERDQFYMPSSNLMYLSVNKYALFYIKFKHSNEYSEYINIRGEISESEYNNIIKNSKIKYKKIEGKLKSRKLVKIYSNENEEQISNIFNKNVITLFPYYRFEESALTKNIHRDCLEFNVANKVFGHMPNPLEVITGVEKVANWIMDLALDIHVSEATTTRTWDAVNHILSLILAPKIGAPVRFGIGPRNFGNTRIQITQVPNGQSIYPSIFVLSSGEAALLCIFCELIRQYDQITGNGTPQEATGIVLIDEIDKHLHIKLQKEVLPKLFKLFPGIQFITTSHAPFFNLGLYEELPSRSVLIDLDNNGILKGPTENDIYAEAYDVMISENDKFKNLYDQLKFQIASSTNPLIITEGKTDVHHIRAAKKALNIDIDLDFFEINGDWGDSKLSDLLDNISKLKQQRKIIGIFDRDAPKIISKIETNDHSYKNYGNNVYAFCIPKPQARSLYTNISIEFYYNDNTIKKEKDGKRLLFDNEVELVMAGNKTGGFIPRLLHQVDSTKEHTKKIFDQDIGSISTAHSKSRFAELVENDSEFRQGIDFSNFNLLFNKLTTILALPDV